MGYDARADFDLHQREVDEAIRTLTAAGWAPSAGHRVLDLGGGQGMHVGYLAAQGLDVTCADIINYVALYDGEFFKRIREKHELYGVPFDTARINFVTTDAMNMVFRDQSFDVVVSFNAFEHIPDPSAALFELMRILRPGGYAYIAFDPLWTADTGSHFYHRVPSPWAHLIHDDEAYTQQMRAAGATEEECAEYRGAMNRWRRFQFEASFARLGAQVVFSDDYQGLADESHRVHPNMRAALLAGYSTTELLTRRLRWAIRKA